jgi:virginiamycin B lyase
VGPGTRPKALIAGPDGNLWFAGVGYRAGKFTDVVGKVTPRGKVSEFVIDAHDGNLGLSDIAVGADGNLWFTEGGRTKIGRITPAGQVAEFELGNAKPAEIVAGPDGNLISLSRGTSG